MSDGPHRSLPLGRRWKKVAECADNASFSLEDVRKHLDSAILSDFKSDDIASLLKEIRRLLCSSDQGLLFPVSSDAVEGLRLSANGSPLGNLILDCAVDAVESGKKGEDALSSTFAEATQEWTQRHCRGMEEHYQREAGAKRAANFQARMSEMQNGYAAVNISQRLAEGGRAMTIKPVVRRSGIDEGVSLR